MSNIWFISDTHFEHANMLKFVKADGSLVRPGFCCVNEMNERMINNWNTVVKPGDHVWHLGDFAMGNHTVAERIIKRLHGRKRLCVGNHDNVKEVAPFFEKVVLWRIFKEFNFTCSHMPLRLDQLRKTEFNVHGHIHQHKIADPHYINICVEHTNYTPIHLDELLTMIRKAI